MGCALGLVGFHYHEVGDLVSIQVRRKTVLVSVSVFFNLTVLPHSAERLESEISHITLGTGYL